MLAELIPIGALPLQLPAKGTPPSARDASGLPALLRAAGATDRRLAAVRTPFLPRHPGRLHQGASWWLWWIQARGLDLSDVDSIEADTFAAAMRHAGYANGSRDRYLGFATLFRRSGQYDLVRHVRQADRR